MAGPFDATLKQLLDAFAADWVRLFAPRLGLPADVAAEPANVDLSTVQLAADGVFRLQPPAEGLLHLELQSSWDGELPDRLHEYATLLRRRHGGPVYSVAVLLRPEANATAVTGTLRWTLPDGREQLRYEYEVVRVWELPAEPLLAGGLGRPRSPCSPTTPGAGSARWSIGSTAGCGPRSPSLTSATG